MEKEKAITKITELKKTDPRVDEVGLLLINFEMEMIACGNETTVKRNGKDFGQIDLIFVDKELKMYFFIEVSTEKKSQSKKIDSFFRKWKDAKNIEEIRAKFELQTIYKIVYLYFELSGKEDVAGSVTKKKNEFVLSEWDLKYFLDAYRKIGVWARNDFMSYLDIKPRERGNKEKIAIQFFIGDLRAYVYVDSAIELLRYCYVFRRKNKDVGYQRVFKERRMAAIAKKIQDPGFLAFPNAILINCPDKKQLCNEGKKDKSECPCYTKINIPNNFCSCRIIDGQHRPLGFAKLDHKKQESHFMPVIIIENIDEEREVKTFIEINSGQERMDKNLILLLEAEFDWDIENSPREFYEKQAVVIIKKLNHTERSPLQGMVFLPDALAKQKGKITLATFVSAIIKNNFIGKKLHLFQKDIDDVDTPYKRIKEIFDLTNKRILQSQVNGKSFWFTNSGIRILFRIVQVFERNIHKGYIKCSLDEFFCDLGGICTKSLFEQLKESFGEGGANKKVEEIFKKIKRVQRARYEKVITDLRKI